MYLYETHLHTSPVSVCAKSTIEEMLNFYKKQGYSGVFITNHFIDRNSYFNGISNYEGKIDIYFSHFEKALKMSKEIGIDVFFGIEMSYGGTDFLVYGLDKEWFLKNPQVESMQKSQILPYMIENGALVIQAHPFREANYIDHIRLFPRCVQGVEVFNACRTDFANKMAKIYAKEYGLLNFAGSDNHNSSTIQVLGGMKCETPIKNEKDFVQKVLNGQMKPFKRKVK